jgi:hypothetical protein
MSYKVKMYTYWRNGFGLRDALDEAKPVSPGKYVLFADFEREMEEAWKEAFITADARANELPSFTEDDLNELWKHSTAAAMLRKLKEG